MATAYGGGALRNQYRGIGLPPLTPSDRTTPAQKLNATQGPPSWMANSSAMMQAPQKAMIPTGGGSGMFGGYTPPPAGRAGSFLDTDPSWLRNIQPMRVDPTAFSAFNGSGVNGSADPMQFNAVTVGDRGTISPQDWGLDAAARAQVDLIRDWGQQNMAAAAQSEIARGMGRSGSYDAVQAREMDISRMEAANQMAQAAAEQGRLNQETAIASAGNRTQRDIAQGQLEQAYNELQANYDLGIRNFELEAWVQNQEQELSRLQFDEGKRQFNYDLAQRQTQDNRGYQMDRLDFSEGQRQYDNSYGLNAWDMGQGHQLGWADLSWQQQEAAMRANLDLQLGQMQYGGDSFGNQMDMMNYMLDRDKLNSQNEQWFAERAYGADPKFPWMDPVNGEIDPNLAAFLREGGINPSAAMTQQATTANEASRPPAWWQQSPLSWLGGATAGWF